MKTGDHVRGKLVDADLWDDWVANGDDGLPTGRTKMIDNDWYEGTLIIMPNDYYGTIYTLAESGKCLDYHTIEVLEERDPDPPGHKEDTNQQRIWRLLGLDEEEEQ